MILFLLLQKTRYVLWWYTCFLIALYVLVLLQLMCFREDCFFRLLGYIIILMLFSIYLLTDFVRINFLDKKLKTLYMVKKVLQRSEQAIVYQYMFGSCEY